MGAGARGSSRLNCQQAARAGMKAGQKAGTKPDLADLKRVVVELL
jgi:hypothetical protein